MPAITRDDGKPQVPIGAFRVLVTGFGGLNSAIFLPQPFAHYGDNPSWLAVEPLQNTVLYTDIHSKSSSHPEIAHDPQPIHITTLKVPVVYQDVLDIVPGLHARPPHLPADAPGDCVPAPASNYDFVFHLGVAGRGPLRMERLGHKLGYHMKDAKGKLAPVVRVSPKDFSRHGDPVGGPGGEPTALVERMIGGGAAGLTMAESMERERLGMSDIVEAGDPQAVRPTRGFGVGYETLPEEITSDIDVTRLVHDLKRSGVEQIYTSMDAGHYLCDFIYYCSLAEVKRASKPYEKRQNTQVLFLHCPPVDQPLGTAEVTDAIKRIVVWVCSELQLHDAKEAVVANS